MRVVLDRNHLPIRIFQANPVDFLIGLQVGAILYLWVPILRTLLEQAGIQPWVMIFTVGLIFLSFSIWRSRRLNQLQKESQSQQVNRSGQGPKDPSLHFSGLLSLLVFTIGLVGTIVVSGTLALNNVLLILVVTLMVYILAYILSRIFLV